MLSSYTVVTTSRKENRQYGTEKNLCAQVPISLHAQVCEAREAAGQTTSEYITDLLIEYYNLKKNGGTAAMSGNTRPMAFQIPEELFQRIKAHLERETQRTGRKLTQREFVLNLIEDMLTGVEAKSAHSVSASGENCVCSLASPFPAGPATLGSGGNPNRLAADEAERVNAAMASGNPTGTTTEEDDSEEEDLPPEKP